MEAPRVVVLGAGPGGMSAALWCASLGLEVTVLERNDRPGGQLCDIAAPVDNQPGMPGMSAPALARALAEQVSARCVALRFAHGAVLDRDALRVRVDPRRVSLSAAAVVIATGTRRRLLDVPGERALQGRGVAYNVGAHADAWRGRDVVVVGGGDDAFEHAALLALYARAVTLVHRSDRYTARPELVAPVRSAANVTVRPFARIAAIEGADRVQSVSLHTLAGIEALPTDGVFVCIGPQPNTDGLGLAVDPMGYLLVDRLQRTVRPGVWAVGDVCCPESPTIATAMGQGATAAKSIAATLARGGLYPPWPLEVPWTPRTEGATDTLSVVGITFPARIGVYPRERQRLQTLTFEVGFDVNAAAAAPADALRETIDYAAVARCIEELLAAQHFNLIETVAHTVAATLLSRFASRSVRVRVTKPGVPQRQSTASVEVTRTRAT